MSKYKPVIDTIYTHGVMTDTGNKYSMLNVNPFNNCQLFSIGDFATILTSSNAYDILSEMFKATTKSLFIVDIKECFEKYVENLFHKEGIVIKNKYISTNNSRMTIYIINKQYIKNMKYKNLLEQVLAKKFKTFGQVYSFVNAQKELRTSSVNTAGHSYPPSFKPVVNPSMLTNGSLFNSTHTFQFYPGTSCYLVDILAVNEKVTINELLEELVDIKKKYTSEKKDIELRIKTMKELGVEEMTPQIISAVKLLDKINATKDKKEILAILSDAL